MSLRACTLALLACAACGAAGEPAFIAPVYARGGAASFAAGAWSVTLTRAEVGLGPLYFCATAAASADLCPSAVAEWTDAATVDAIDPAPQELGEVDCLPAEHRSVMFDYGVTWYGTQAKPTPTRGAPGGFAARFAGTAVREDMSLSFTADIPLAPALRGARAIEGLRVPAHEPAPGERLDIALDPARWWAAVDFDELAALGPGPHALGPDTRAHAAVRFAMVGAPPTFTWSAAGPPRDGQPAEE